MPDQSPAAASVKRYDTQLYSSTLYERKDGRYVTYTDFAAAIAERDAAQAECERLKTSNALHRQTLAQFSCDLSKANESIRKMGEAADAERQRLLVEVERLKGYLRSFALQAEYDCPGDTPEFCEWICQICRGGGTTIETVEHNEQCPLKA